MLVGKPKLVQLKDLTSKEFLDTKIFGNLDTWPYCPRGTLRKPRSDEIDPSESTSKLVEIQNQEYNDAKHFLATFSEKQKSVIGWILACMHDA